jgi:hypothetical protein
MLSFTKTALHPFAPVRHQDSASDYDLYTPCLVHLLPGHRVTVDFQLAVLLPPGHRADLRLAPTHHKLRLHSLPLCESRWPRRNSASVINSVSFNRLSRRRLSPEFGGHL